MSDREKVINEQQKEIEELEERIAIILEGQQEIVRCKDCKHGVKSPIFQYYPNLTWCNKHSQPHDDDWFCADGERKPTQLNAKNDALDVR